jgi:uncharacterized protein
VDEQPQREANRATLERLFTALNTADYGALASLYTDDYVLELPFADPEPVRAQGLAEVATTLGPMLETFRFTLDLVDVHDCVDPDLLVAEYTSKGTITTTGKPYANTYIGLYRFRDGRVCGVKEFYNPLVALRATTPD